MIRATDLGQAARPVDQLTAHVEASVVEALDLVRRGADEQDRHVGDFVNVGITHLGNALLAQGHLPDPGPEPFLFELVILRFDVPLDRDVMVAEERRRIDAQVRGDGPRIGVKQLLVQCRGSDGSSPAPGSMDRAHSSRTLGSRDALLDHGESGEPDAHLRIALPQLAFDPAAGAVKQAPFAPVGNANCVGLPPRSGLSSGDDVLQSPWCISKLALHVRPCASC